jgi:hypothetical protein
MPLEPLPLSNFRNEGGVPRLATPSVRRLFERFAPDLLLFGGIPQFAASPIVGGARMRRKRPAFAGNSGRDRNLFESGG